jgi:hypothetical protein
MLTDHRHPLAAYGFVALACALVLWQPTLGSTMAGSPPVVKLLTETGVISSAVLQPVTGVEPDVVQVAAPEGELPMGGSDGDALPDVDPVAETPPPAAPTDADAPASNAGVPGGDQGGGPDSGGPGRGPATPDDEPQKQSPDPGVADHPGKGLKHKGPDHPGKGPQGKGHERPGHPGKGPEAKGAGHPGKNHQAADHPGKGPRNKGAKSKGPKHKGPKGKGHERPDHPGKGPRGRG